MAVKYSRQREAIWDYIKGRKDHPTADMVYTYVKKAFPNISLATVYRNLVLLTEMGKLRAVYVGDGTVHFDPDVSDHDHFICKKCGKVIDVPDYFERAKADNESFPGRVDGSFTVFYGLCEKCLAKGNEKPYESNGSDT